jgi:hypothetical protein
MSREATAIPMYTDSKPFLAPQALSLDCAIQGRAHGTVDQYVRLTCRQLVPLSCVTLNPRTKREGESYSPSPVSLDTSPSKETDIQNNDAPISLRRVRLCESTRSRLRSWTNCAGQDDASANCRLTLSGNRATSLSTAQTESTPPNRAVPGSPREGLPQLDSSIQDAEPIPDR